MLGLAIRRTVLSIWDEPRYKIQVQVKEDAIQKKRGVYRDAAGGSSKPTFTEEEQNCISFPPSEARKLAALCQREESELFLRISSESLSQTVQ